MVINKTVIVGNRLGIEKANGFGLRFGTLSQHLYIVWLSYERFDVT